MRKSRWSLFNKIYEDTYKYIDEIQRQFSFISILLEQVLCHLCPTCGLHAVQSRVLCGPVEVFAVVNVSCILTTCPCFGSHKFETFDASGLQYYFITSVTIAVRIKANLVR